LKNFTIYTLHPIQLQQSNNGGSDVQFTYSAREKRDKHTEVWLVASKEVQRLGYKMDSPGFESLQVHELFFSQKVSRPTLGLTQSAVGKGVFFSGDKAASARC